MVFDWFKKKEGYIKNPTAPDYSHVDSNEKAIDLFEQKQLVKLFLMPIDFGGHDSAMNILYVPEHVQVFKSRFDSKIEDLLVSGKKLSYAAVPEYKGKSFIPCKLVIKVSGDADFTETIHIW